MPLSTAIAIGSAEPATASSTLTNAKAQVVVENYAEYLGIPTQGRTTRQISEAIARAQLKAMMEGAREVYLRKKRVEGESAILAQADADSPLLPDNPGQTVEPTK